APTARTTTGASIALAGVITPRPACRSAPSSSAPRPCSWHRDRAEPRRPRRVGGDAERVRERPADTALALDGVDDRHVVGVRDALEAVEFPDHQVGRGECLPRAERAEPAVDRPEILREAAASQSVDGAGQGRVGHLPDSWPARYGTGTYSLIPV